MSKSKQKCTVFFFFLVLNFSAFPSFGWDMLYVWVKLKKITSNSCQLHIVFMEKNAFVPHPQHRPYVPISCERNSTTKSLQTNPNLTSSNPQMQSEPTAPSRVWPLQLRQLSFSASVGWVDCGAAATALRHSSSKSPTSWLSILVNRCCGCCLGWTDFLPSWPLPPVPILGESQQGGNPRIVQSGVENGLHHQVYLYISKHETKKPMNSHN